MIGAVQRRSGSSRRTSRSSTRRARRSSSPATSAPTPTVRRSTRSPSTRRVRRTSAARPTTPASSAPRNPDGFRLVNAFQAAYGGGDGDAVLQKLGYSVDLSLTKLANVGTLLPGQNVTFTLQVANPSTDPASGVVVTDNLPAGLEYVSCTVRPRRHLRRHGQQPLGVLRAARARARRRRCRSSRSWSRRRRASRSPTRATVTAGVLDPVPANNTATANVGVPTLEPTGDADGDGLSNDFETQVRARSVRRPRLRSRPTTPTATARPTCRNCRKARTRAGS